MPSTELSSIEIERSGGQIPTLRPTFRVDVAGLSSADRQKLEELVRNAHLDQPTTRSAKAGIPDAFSYRLTLKRADQPEQVLSFADQDGHPARWDDLVEWVRAHAGR